MVGRHHRRHPGLDGYVRVVVVTIHIGADAVAVVIVMPVQAVGYAATITVGRSVIDGGGVSVVAGVTSLIGNVRVVIIAIHISADAVAVVIADTGAGGGCTGAVAVGVHLVVGGGVVAIVAGIADIGGKRGQSYAGASRYSTHSSGAWAGEPL